jgi:hypothetical protein
MTRIWKKRCKEFQHFTKHACSQTKTKLQFKIYLKGTLKKYILGSQTRFSGWIRKPNLVFEHSEAYCDHFPRIPFFEWGKQLISYNRITCDHWNHLELSESVSIIGITWSYQNQSASLESSGITRIYFLLILLEILKQAS